MQIIQGDCLEVLKTLPDQSVQTIVTSPPYYGLRDYGVSGQIGLEPTPDEYVAKLVSVFRECRRVLRDDGTLWLNLGDSYAGSGKGGQSEDKRSENWQPEYANKGYLYGLKPKDLIGIPWRVAFALQQPYYRCLGCENVAHASEWGKFPNGRLICPACELSKGHAIDEQGWYLRSDIIWHKPNPMPESVKDRPTKAHEYIFLLAKSQRYYYDHQAIQEPSTSPTETAKRYEYQFFTGPKHESGKYSASGQKHTAGYKNLQADGQQPNTMHLKRLEGEEYLSPVRNKRSVWTVTTKPYREAHFATFPPDLIEPCILAGCPVGGTVLDPFNGSGTTGAVALKHGRDYIGIELNPEYIELTYKRLSEVQPRLEVE